MNTHLPYYELDRVAKLIGTKFSSVNYGGCGYAAYLLYTALRTMTPEVRLIYDGGDGIRSGRLHHIWVEFLYNDEWLVIDSLGIQTQDQMKRRYCGRKSVDIIPLIVRNGDRSQWNSDFNRAQMPAMKALINDHFNMVGVL